MSLREDRVVNLKEKQQRYSFEYLLLNTWRGKWVRSKKDFDTIEAAASAATSWMHIAFENNCPIAVRLCGA